MTDSPRLIDKDGTCTGCRYRFDWTLLEPMVHRRGTIGVYCPSCRMDRAERKAVCCEGDGDAKIR